MVKPLAKSLANVYKNVVRCSNCGNLKVFKINVYVKKATLIMIRFVW